MFPGEYSQINNIPIPPGGRGVITPGYHLFFPYLPVSLPVRRTYVQQDPSAHFPVSPGVSSATNNQFKGKFAFRLPGITYARSDQYYRRTCCGSVSRLSLDSMGPAAVSGPPCAGLYGQQRFLDVGYHVTHRRRRRAVLRGGLCEGLSTALSDRTLRPLGLSSCPPQPIAWPYTYHKGHSSDQ